jgi:hypothetical protein
MKEDAHLLKLHEQQPDQVSIEEGDPRVRKYVFAGCLSLGLILYLLFSILRTRFLTQIGGVTGLLLCSVGIFVLVSLLRTIYKLM